MRFVVTCPFGAKPLEFAVSAAGAGAHYLEIRDDLTDGCDDIHGAAGVLPLLVARRREPHLPGAWIEAAALVDQEISLPRQKMAKPQERIILSHHARSAMSLDQAVGLWKSLEIGDCAVKHIEPFVPGCETRLLQLRDRLRQISERVTVLAMGPGAAALRRRLAARNHLHYCALTPESRSAAGQALLAEELAFFTPSSSSTGAGW